jgi:leucyl-tRNA synthetase
MYPRYDFESWMAETRAELNSKFAGKAITPNLLTCIQMCLDTKIRDLRDCSYEADYWLVGVQMYWEDKYSILYHLVLREGYETSSTDSGR